MRDSYQLGTKPQEIDPLSERGPKARFIGTSRVRNARENASGLQPSVVLSVGASGLAPQAGMNRASGPRNDARHRNAHRDSVVSVFPALLSSEMSAGSVNFWTMNAAFARPTSSSAPSSSPSSPPQASPPLSSPRPRRSLCARPASSRSAAGSARSPGCSPPAPAIPPFARR